MYCPKIIGKECNDYIRENCDSPETSCSPLWTFGDPFLVLSSKGLAVNTESMGFLFEEMAAEGY